MRHEKGFIRGVAVPLLFVAMFGYALYRSEFSFSFRGRDIIKPIWEVIVDKTVSVGTKVASIFT